MWTIISILVYFFIISIESTGDYVLKKCCPIGYALSDDLRCVMSTRGDNFTVQNELVVGSGTETCYRSGDRTIIEPHDAESDDSRNLTSVEQCVDIDHRNGSIYTRTCPHDWREKSGKCDSIFTPLIFWGASIVVFASLFYLFPYLIVVIFYFVVADLRHRAYDRSVLGHNACQLVIAIILITMGYFVLCHKPIKPAWIFIATGLSLQFLTLTSVFWMNVICFDMTLVITRLRWKPGSDVTGSEEDRKFRIYAAYVWGGGLLITSITGFMELCPWIPASSPLKPNFERFDDGANYSVILHVSTVPIITLILNNVMFIYTTYKVIKIRQSTAAATGNNRTATKKYFIFLRLYLLMDAPWIVGVLAAVYPEIWILKFVRMLQPTLMMFAMLPNKTLSQAFKCSRSPATVNPKIRTKQKCEDTRI